MYGTLEDANTYFESRLHVDAWDEATDANKTKALEEAQKRIDLLNFSGYQIEEDAAFPRYYGDEPEGDEEVPENIKIAGYECAFALLDGVDPEFEQENLAVSSESYSQVSTTYVRRKYIPEHFAAGIPSAYAWRFLLQYLKTPGSVSIYRV